MIRLASLVLCSTLTVSTVALGQTYYVPPPPVFKPTLLPTTPVYRPPAPNYTPRYETHREFMDRMRRERLQEPLRDDGFTRQEINCMYGRGHIKNC